MDRYFNEDDAYRRSIVTGEHDEAQYLDDRRREMERLMENLHDAGQETDTRNATGNNTSGQT